uniref:Chitin-binding type-2 domain-containing protein n=1 Tax=Steinernema glaseri TaxID=37863 RepID=A0A1I8AVT0_9BILA
MGLRPLLCAVFVLGAVHAFQLRALLDDVGINCPSGNRVYIHPISGDLQQCSQQLGFYNQTSCPGGTVCERFPILIPGFQDYCCWADETTDDEEETNGVLPVPEAISGAIFGTAPPPLEETKEDEDEEDEWIPMPTPATPRTKKTKRPPRSRRLRTTTTEAPTTTTTTTRPPPARRGPKCRNPDDAALIDFGNRLRDCYFQQCPFGYRCEFNAEIRRYVCCGAERDVFPPPGLPPLPAPKPVVPRPFRPQRPPYYHDDESLECPSGGEYRPSPSQIAVCSKHDPQLKCPTSHQDCVHSRYAGQMVCCQLGGVRRKTHCLCSFTPCWNGLNQIWRWEGEDQLGGQETAVARTTGESQRDRSASISPPLHFVDPSIPPTALFRLVRSRPLPALQHTAPPMALTRAVLLAALFVVATARETFLYDSDHKTPVKLRFVPEVSSSARPRPGKSSELPTGLRLLPKDLSNVRLAEPKSRKFMTHEALANNATQGRLALVPADNSVITGDIDLTKILQRTTMKMKPYPTMATTTEATSLELTENEIIEEPIHFTEQHEEPKEANQEAPKQPRPDLPKASQLPPPVVKFE